MVKILLIKKMASIVAVVPEVSIVDLVEIVLVILSVTTKSIYKKFILTTCGSMHIIYSAL